MCGICGSVSDKEVKEGDLRRMMDLLAHRGPDDQGLRIAPGAGLGHRRLSIIDLQTGHQPIANEDESMWVVLNGEIYNYRDLKKNLMGRGHRFATASDTEVIVHLYEEYGAECVQHLRGMFAFAIWDANRQELFAARDHLGQKPFFYAQIGEALHFASEIKALLDLDPSLAEIDPAALDQYLTLRIIAPPRTMFRKIRKLPPAHTLTFDLQRGVRVGRYWDLRYEPKMSGSEEDLTDSLEEQIIDCLKLHLVSDVPVGAFMSGGLDSTLLVAMLMKHNLSGPLQTFTIGLPHGRFDEAPFARMVADRYGTRHREQTITPSLLDTLPKLIWHLDEPSDPLALCSFLIARMAREDVKVVLGGDGGDELFGGYDRYYGNQYATYYSQVPYPLRRYVIDGLLRLLPEGSWYKSRRHQMKWLHALSFLSGGERYARSLSYFYFGPRLREELYGPVMKDAVSDFDSESSIREAYEKADAVDPLDRMLRADSNVRLPDHPVMILDRMTMAHGLEARSPLMDHKLAEFAARLPVSLKVKGRTLRYIQVRLAERYLPSELLKRPKQGFSSALPYMLRDEIRLLAGTFLSDSHLVRDGFYTQVPVRRVLEEHLRGKADHGNRLWLLLNSEVWYRMLLEGASAADMLQRIATAKKAGG